MITILMIFGAICTIWVFSKIIRANSYNQMNYNTYRNRTVYQDNPLEDLLGNLTLRQRYAFMMVYIIIIERDSTGKLYDNIDAKNIMGRAYRLLRVTYKETTSYMENLDFGQFISILSSVRRRTLTDCLLFDYIELTKFIEKKEDQIKAINAVVKIYSHMGYTDNDIKNVIEKTIVLSKEFYGR